MTIDALVKILKYAMHSERQEVYMPSLIIHDEDFALLSEHAKREIFSLLLKDDGARVGDSSAMISQSIKDKKYTDSPSFHVWRNLVIEAKDNKQNHAKMELILSDLHNLLPKIFGPFPATQNLHGVSVELAISVLRGLGDESKNALYSIVISSRDNGISREELAAVVGGVGKINGTIGSINKRYSRRFNIDFYGSKVESFKLIEFSDGYYRLVCDPASFELAFKILSHNNLNSLGEYSLELQNGNGDHFFHEISALAIECADSGMAYFETIIDEYETSSGGHSDTYNVAISLPKSTLILGPSSAWMVREFQFDTHLGSCIASFDND